MELPVATASVPKEEGSFNGSLDEHPALKRMQAQVAALTAELRSRDAALRAERLSRDAEQLAVLEELKQSVRESIGLLRGPVNKVVETKIDESLLGHLSV